jgi:hypothetical protein
MFERYTEKARRAIFFGRYEACQYGSPDIETEHLILGLLREIRPCIVGFRKQIPRRSAAASMTSMRQSVRRFQPRLIYR